MREIEFRIRDRDKWYYGVPLSKIKNDTVAFQSYDGNYYDLFADATTLGQYTGLKDKNGKKIFEGDIISADYYPFIEDGKQNYVGIVTFYDDICSFQYELQCVNKDKRGISNGINEEFEPNDDLILEDFEVIGNIFDNPELLKGK